MESVLALAIRGAINQKGNVMFYFLIAVIGAWVASYFLYQEADKPGDVIFLGIVAWGFILISVVSTFAYIATALYLHRFI